MNQLKTVHQPTDVPVPFECYSGDGPYAFVSYAHADKVNVYRSIREFHENGINVWYDEGIPPAGEWVEELAQAIKKSSIFVVFVSPRAADSRYVKMEVQYALSEQKEILTIFLEDTILPPGLSLCLQQFQSIFFHEKNWKENACKALLERQDSLVEQRTHSTNNDSVENEELIDHGVQLWTFWSKAIGAQNKRYELRKNSIRTLDNLPLSTPVENPKHEEYTETPVNSASSEREEITRHPSTVNVTVSETPELKSSEVKETHLNSYAGNFKWIPPGQITILIPYSDERRMVQVSNGFWMGEFLITQEVFTKIMGSNPSFAELSLGESAEQFPVNNVSWLDAVSFCQALTMLAKNENELPINHEYRLPTEVEWEYACRAGTQSDYYFGDDCTDLHNHGWFRGNSRKQPHPVGLKNPNPWGLYDLYGNVREWVGNSFVNTLLNDSEQDEFRISRGGGYMKPAIECKSASRSTNSLHHRFRNLGFRVALAPKSVS
ncbi:MAG: hypothetical protein CMI27_01105 [Opitutae bacterium]|nr:hypothetical protein [Opitutae bacterium]